MSNSKKTADAQVEKKAKSPPEGEKPPTVADKPPPVAAKDTAPAATGGDVPITPPLNHEQLQRLRRKLKAKFH